MTYKDKGSYESSPPCSSIISKSITSTTRNLKWSQKSEVDSGDFSILLALRIDIFMAQIAALRYFHKIWLYKFFLIYVSTSSLDSTGDLQ